MASTMLDLPEPLGPTTTVTPAGNSNRVLSAKLLKPANSSAFNMRSLGSSWAWVELVIHRRLNRLSGC